ncbi:MAG TPA: hypothetical protein VHM19_14625, partial [Polyangiales bacterium]|nr:hypothetical protein [Polyangiales bacterium]
GSAVLDGLARARGTADAARPIDPVAAQLAAALEAKGWSVDVNVGASRFRCDLAVRKRGESRYRLGILIDSETHYDNADLDDRYRLKPALLAAFGWNLRWVLTRDYWLDPDAVLARLESALAG